MTRSVFGAFAIGVATAAWAHGGEDHSGHAGWTLDPWVTVPLALLLLVYLVGRSRLARRSSIAPRSPALFLAGWAVLTLSLVSPLHAGGERSFTVHMIEHELIMLVATFLLAASSSGGSSPGAFRRPRGDGLAAAGRLRSRPCGGS